MTRVIISAAAVAAALAFAAPAQATMANPGLSNAAPATVQLARHYRHSYRDWRHHYAYSPRRHRHCWTVRVHTWGHHWRWVRRCAWRNY